MKKALVAVAVAGLVLAQGCAIIGANNYKQSLQREARALRASAPVYAPARDVDAWWYQQTVDKPALRGAFSVQQYNGVNVIETDITLWSGYREMWRQNPGEATWRTLVDLVAGGGVIWGISEIADRDSKRDRKAEVKYVTIINDSGEVTYISGDNNSSSRGDRTTTTNPEPVPLAAEPVVEEAAE